MPLRLIIDGTRFRDTQNREIILHGINVAADAKFPSIPDQPSHISEGFLDGDNVSFVGRPFSVESAHEHFSRLKRWGYNTIRYVFTWEAIEHSGPGKYDDEWVEHTIAILRLAKEYGFYIFMDPHQDVVCTSMRIPSFATNTRDSGRDSVADLVRPSGHYTPAVSTLERSMPPKPRSSRIHTPTPPTSQR